METTRTLYDWADDVNNIAAFLAHSQIPSLGTCKPVDCIIICASSVLYQASHVFKAIQNRPSLAKVLVLVGGIGHSTDLIYDAVARHPEYHEIKDNIIGKPEAAVLMQVLAHYFSLSGSEHGGPQVLMEDRSTNCGANAVETRKKLDEAGITGPLSCVIVQDPTMSLRTVMSFEKAYEDLPPHDRPRFTACPVFIPETRMAGGQPEYVLDPTEGPRAEDLWEKQRMCELLVGEVTRLNDDENGYGPNGKGFIGHVDVPEEIVQAAKRVKDILGVDR